ncbi:MAG: hypothetical protein GXO75_01725 [Calditrichaeota bacterium]|nr:hypothetical protein [Calditrichota bacterium]
MKILHQQKRYISNLFILMILLLPAVLFSQNYNPPFPRTVFQSPYGTSGGAADYFFSRYDLAVHGLRQEQAKAMNDSIRAWNPDILIFGTSRQGVWAGTEPPGMFAYCAAFYKLTSPAQAGDTEIHFQSASDYTWPTRHKYALVGEDDWIKYRSIDENGIYGIPSSGDYGLNSNHAVGDSVKFPHRMSGFGMLHNMTSLAPKVDGKETWRWFIDDRFRRQDFSVYDGVFYDAFRLNFWLDDFEKQAGIDFNYNHISDLDEHGYAQAGLAWVNDRWKEGITPMLEYEHQKFSELHPGKWSIVTLNTGAAEDNYGLDTVEGMLWEGFMRFSTNWESMMNVNRKWDQKMQERGITNFTMIIDYERESRAEWGKNTFNRMRYGLTTALLSGCFYGRTFGDYYYITFYHDEFDTDLGYPSSEPQELPSGAWVRFFTKGAAICNPTGEVITVNASELEGKTGYEGPYYRFRGGQDPDFNNGQLFTSIELYGQKRKRERDNQGDGILLFKEPVTVVADITVGNTFNNDTSPASEPVELAGDWTEVRDTNDPWPDRNPCFSQFEGSPVNGSVIDDGIGYAYAPPGAGLSTATFRPAIGVPGYYEIAEWHGWLDNPASSQTPFKIVVDGDIKMSGVIDQTRNAGNWKKLAIVYFPKGTVSYIQINNKTSGYILADGMRFRYLGDHPDLIPPSAPKHLRIIRP